MNPFQLLRICTIMSPEEGNELEVEGVLNPAAARAPDGSLYLFPRLVSKNNYSRIGIAKVIFDKAGDPQGVERMGIALEPKEPYEKRENDGGGCEDARVSHLEALGRYFMTYTAFGPDGPRIAMAKSENLIEWERMGMVQYERYRGIDFNDVDNKDASIFPGIVVSPHGHPSVAMLNRPLFTGTRPEEKVMKSESAVTDFEKESIWISYYNLHEETSLNHARFTSNHRLAWPESPWESLKIGAGTPPVMTKHGWMVIYHGVHELERSTSEKPALTYSAGVMILSKENPQKIIYRSDEPILTPELAEERIGMIGNVVFPTGIDRRDDIGQPNRFDVYYGMADDRIGVAKLIIPDKLP